MPDASSVRNPWALSSRSLNRSAPASTWSAGRFSGATIRQRLPSWVSATVPLGLSRSTRVTLSRSTSTTTLSRSAATFFGTIVHASAGRSSTDDSPGRMA